MKGYEKSNHAHQQGFGTIVVLSFVMMLGLSAYVGVRLAPSYMEYRVITQAMDEAVNADSVESMRSQQILALVKRKMGPSATAPNVDLKKITSVFKRDGLKVVKLNYEVAVPMIKNVSALLHYTHEATVNPYANMASAPNSTEFGDTRLIAAN